MAHKVPDATQSKVIPAIDKTSSSAVVVTSDNDPAMQASKATKLVYTLPPLSSAQFTLTLASYAIEVDLATFA